MSAVHARLLISVKMTLKGKIMTKVVLLQKVRRDRTMWHYMVDRVKANYSFEGTITESFAAVIEEIKRLHAPKGEKLIIISQSLMNKVEPVMLTFPEITFLKLSEANLISAFLSAFTVPSYKAKSTPRTLFCGSDASGGHHETLSAWAWATETGYSMGVCQFRDVNISEFEGILRAIVENRGTPSPRIHVYSDSQNAIEIFNNAVIRGGTPKFMAGTYLEALVAEVREILNGKIVTVEWVRGHRSHRLNGAADCLSRHARRSAQTGRSIKTMQLEADAMFAMFAR